jgi:SAM-dependent methyltransferase
METYTPGYSEIAAAFMTRRRLDPNGAFFLPHLQPGTSVLDCGCGPGTITRDIARQVSPGTVTGVDFNADQVALASREAKAQGIANVDFRQCSVYALPFSDNSFDAVFSHALLEHLKEPVKAAVEIKRVLKPGGMLGVCTPDWGGFLLAPPSEKLLLAFEAYKQLQNRNGGDVYCGHKLGMYVEQAGFENIVMRSRYENYDPPDRNRRLPGNEPRGGRGRKARRDMARMGPQSERDVFAGVGVVRREEAVTGNW